MTSTAETSTNCSRPGVLRKRLDGLEGLFAASTLPVGLQLVAVEERPFGHERTRAGRQRSGDQLTVEIDRRDLARVASVEVRASMRAFVPVHPDRDPVEETDPRHAETLRAVADSAVRARAAARSPRRPSGSHNTRF